MTTPPKSVREEFSEIVSGPEREIDLARASLLIAAEEYPSLDISSYLQRLDRMAQRVVKETASGRDPGLLIDAMNRVVFDEERFRGNDEDYYDPRNSFFNEVMDRRLGIPITLSILYMEVARRANIPMVGIGLPGHFIVGLATPARRVYLDPFHRGEKMTVKDCAERVAKIFDGRMALTPEHLEPVSGRGILTRLLMNLKNIYMESRSFAKGYSIIDKMVLAAPHDWAQVRDRGLVRYHLKLYQPALNDLEMYLQNVEDPPDRSDVLKLEKIIMKEMKNPS